MLLPISKYSVNLTGADTSTLMNSSTSSFMSLRICWMRRMDSSPCNPSASISGVTWNVGIDLTAAELGPYDLVRQ